MYKQDGNQDSFKELEQMLLRIESRGLRSLSGDEVMLFGQLYRRVVAALSQARTQGLDDARITYLNQLASRGYGHIYVTESKGWPSVGRFFTTDFPRCIRRNYAFILAAFLITIVAALFAYGVVRRDPGKADVVMGQGAVEMMDSIAERHTGHKDWLPSEERPFASSFIMTHNIHVSALAFATGILLGLPTLLVLFQNGLMLGVVGAAVASRSSQVSLSFWSFVAPHGVIELTAIFIAAGAGLMLGWALLYPGEYSRGTAVKLAGREAFVLMLGVIAMLVVAGTIEGFFSPSMIPDRVKLVAAAFLALAEYGYFFLAGRGGEQTAGRTTDHRLQTTALGK